MPFDPERHPSEGWGLEQKGRDLVGRPQLSPKAKFILSACLQAVEGLG